MMKGTLDKMNATWETTAEILGDNWIKTVTRIVTPNAYKTLLEIFIYLFINGMVTVSAVVFLAILNVRWNTASYAAAIRTEYDDISEF